MNVPVYVAVIEVIAVVALAVAVTAVIRRAQEGIGGRAGVPLAVGGALLAWLAATTALALAGVYRATPGAVIPALPIALLIGLLGAWIAATTIPSLRTLIDQSATQPSVLALETWRVVGVVFLILLARDQLPPVFAVPAGLGDIATALAAPFVARRLNRPGGHSLAIVWNMFGLLDLIVAVGLAATLTPGPAQLFHTTPSTVLITEFPTALIPTFGVPLSMALHLLSLRYLLRAHSASAGAAVTSRGLLASGG